jgi:hypothetical protein
MGGSEVNSKNQPDKNADRKKHMELLRIESEGNDIDEQTRRRSKNMLRSFLLP